MQLLDGFMKMLLVLHFYGCPIWKIRFSVQFECGLLLLIVIFIDLIEISKFCLDMTNLEGKHALNRSGVLAGANFIALRRAC